ncbi:hypothetical protein ACFQFC_27335 [Amorphoplanes digitatis]|uniref:Uncharacterized protein n=1 Tax=Actinoplanes digitatis TaxID=1868 RepID=A0A7W7HSH6_9ACTN|nr:hypothetical protein [Actinoplanes digitatis]MBB4759858.1 hypothetical protein [Actinoplanes digitatis]BFE67826.1 hypothetical protein GCM10020092_011270 [Actinoplanes digitatis]GID94464.1 hypothetical protein Adi01nite_38760 [Actinoplanes digitatis]
MLIADGGGGYGGTDWMSKDVRFMWSTIANQDTGPHYDVVEGWRKTADLTLAHRAQVQMYRDNLAAVWPPSKSPAAAAYIERLDQLLVDLQATHDAASANYTTFATVTLTLSLARTKLKPILDEYEANRQLVVDWQAKQDEAAAVTEPRPTPAPGPPPVSSARQEQLNNQARAIMYDLSSTLISGNAALQKPRHYDPVSISRDDPPDGESSTNPVPGFAVAPVIPPPGAGNAGGSGPSVSPVSHSTTAPASPVPPGSSLGGGLVLGGVNPTAVAPPPTSGFPPGPGPSPAPPIATPGPMPGLIAPPGGPGLVPPNGLPPGISVKNGMGTGPANRMTMPSGGVIGATPGSGVIGQMPAGNTGGRAGSAARVNPVGGVIGQQGGPAGRGMTPNGSLVNQSGKGRSRHDDPESKRWDPDNPWATEEGVEPVVLPPGAPGPVDPGPAIGFQR